LICKYLKFKNTFIQQNNLLMAFQKSNKNYFHY
jgi:hypothetical protein